MQYPREPTATFLVGVESERIVLGELFGQRNPSGAGCLNPSESPLPQNRVKVVKGAEEAGGGV